MKPAKLPENESQRLAALHQSQLLDSIREESFDAITLITAQTCEMPMSLICLVDAKRIWLKSTQGVEKISEVNRDIGFCSHTITQPDLFEVQDASTDKIFHDSPLVTDQGLKYYAGVPLVTLDGFALGTLCVMDKKPRALSEEHKEFLRRMALAVTALIEARINTNKSISSSDANSSIYSVNNESDYFKNHTTKLDSSNLTKIFIIDDDKQVNTSFATLFSNEGLAIEIHTTPKDFLHFYRNQPGCIICEAKFSNADGFNFQKELRDKNIQNPLIYIASDSDIPTSVAAIKAGAIDFLEKPLNEQQLLSRVHEALEIDKELRERQEKHKYIIDRLATLTARENEVMALLVADRAKLSNKDIAEKLSISRRTVEVHRSTVMAKMLASSRLELLEFAEICGIPTDN